ncbi:hypothetical protein AAW51_2523 [Caldimonas brevitalea]|uniref:Uncharacterized protein n=1 Tax=Caldimonas brevitalea TaxID=413882 RepID=A0A0G3BIE4_9BURK|nr:hypothetical protein AAW51_2523 [Caldimonas brevitalea]
MARLGAALSPVRKPSLLPSDLGPGCTGRGASGDDGLEPGSASVTADLDRQEKIFFMT